MLELVGLEAQALERVVLDHRFLLEEPEDDLLAEDGRKGGHAEVDLAPVDARGEAAVLGEPPLRDIQPRDDLEPRHHRQVQGPRHLEEVEEQPVDSIAHSRSILVRLDVDVGGVVARRPPEHVVDDLDHGRVVGLRAELLDVDGFLGGGAEPHREPEVLAQRLVDPFRRDHAPVRAVDRLLDGGAGADAEVDLQAGGAAEVVDGDHVQGVRGGDDEAAPVALGGDHPMLARDFLGDQLDHVEVEGAELLAGDGLLAELRAEVLEQHLLVDEVHVDEDLPQALLRPPLAIEGRRHLLVGENAVLDEHLAERHPAPALGRRRHAGSCPSSTSRRRTSSRPGCPSPLSERNAR